MLDIEPRKILVCVSPGEDCDASLDFAVAEARRRGCGIHLALVVRPLVGPRDVVDLRLIDGEWRKYGTDFLIACEKRVNRLANGQVPVSTEITHGAVVPALVQVSQNAGLVVMQHHRMDHAHSVPTLSATNGVAARAHAPVVAVPDGWREKGLAIDVVAVGVEDAESSASVVRWAFEEAQRLSGGVRLVRAWFFSAAFDADVFAGQAGLVQTARIREEMQRDFADLIGAFPDVPRELVAVHGQPADVLVAQSHFVARLVVGRHQPRLPFGSHLGPVTRAVLGRAACPVVVVDPRVQANSTRSTVSSTSRVG
jgi:nucleotide-binding universal stress UspA family protein